MRYPGLFNYSYGVVDTPGPQIDLTKKHAYFNSGHSHLDINTGNTVRKSPLVCIGKTLYRTNPFRETLLTDPEVQHCEIGSLTVRNGVITERQII